MLAPGEYLLVPAPPDRDPQNPTGSDGQPPLPPKDEKVEDESEPFIVLLLRALGAIHT